MGISLKGFTKPTPAGTGGIQGLTARPPASSSVRLPGGFGQGDGAPPPAVQTYFPEAVTFNGSTSIYQQGGTTGAFTANQGMISVWVRPTDTASTRAIFSTYDSGGFTGLIELRIDTGGVVAFVTRANDGTHNNKILITVNETITAGSWNHILLLWDGLNTTRNLVWINNIEATYSTRIAVAGTSWCPRNMSISRRRDGSFYYSGDMAELYITDGFFDLRIEENRRKFISAEGFPVDLGTLGATPTGVRPRVYFQGDAASWNSLTHSGSLLTSGNWSLAGGTTNSVNEPVTLPTS